MFSKEEHRGKGYATGSLESILDAWWNLSHEKIKIFVEEVSLDRDEKEKAGERLCAVLMRDVRGGGEGRVQIKREDGKMCLSWRIISDFYT